MELISSIYKNEQANSTTGKSDLPWDLKLNKGGRGRPLGRRVLGSLSSSKNGWTQASNWIIQEMNGRRKGEQLYNISTEQPKLLKSHLQQCSANLGNTGKTDIRGRLLLGVDVFGKPVEYISHQRIKPHNEYGLGTVAGWSKPTCSL